MRRRIHRIEVQPMAGIGVVLGGALGLLVAGANALLLWVGPGGGALLTVALLASAYLLLTTVSVTAACVVVALVYNATVEYTGGIALEIRR